jgi:UDPglucose--hexose-1-phosphate uridylyltransferase
MPEFRRDPITGRSVIIAAGRSKRPRQHGARNAQAHGELCPFCAGNEAMTPPEVWALRENDSHGDKPGWTVRVVPNKYPALENHGALAAKKDAFYESLNGLGVHEVIIESPDHEINNMGALSIDQCTAILRAYRARMRALGDDSRWSYLLLYKNHGERAGATLEHVHSQLIALPVMPQSAADELNRTEKHYDSTGHCISCEIVQREVERGERLVSQSEKFIALCPFAPRFGYEAWILPKNHVAAFEQSTDEDIAALAQFLKDFILRLNRALDQPAFNYVICSKPPHQSATRYYHWRIEIMPQIARAAGFEWGSGMYMNAVAPEEAARLLRDAAL